MSNNENKPDSNQQSNHDEKEKQLHIFVNRLKFDRQQGVKEVMSADDLARLVELSAETATVKWATGKQAGEEVTQPVEVKNGDQFIVTRKQVQGGFVPRIEAELEQLRESGQKTSRAGVSFVIYHDVPTGRSESPFTDVLVPVPNGYPASMLDRAGLPANSPLVGHVPGSPQETVNIEGKAWRMISYHPHACGGGKPWNPSKHGFHTYLGEILAWLRVKQ